MLSGFKDIRCSTPNGVFPGKECHALLFRLAGPWAMEVRCPRCRRTVLYRFDPKTGLPQGEPELVPERG